MEYEKLKGFNKDRKLIKKWQKSFRALVASESLIKLIPRVIGPKLGKIGTFPNIVRSEE